MFQKILDWFKEGKVKAGRVTDFPNAEECDPNEPCRNIEPQKVNGFKITLPAFFEWWFKPKDEEK